MLLQNMEAWVWTSATAWQCQRSWATSAAEASPWPSGSRRTWPPLLWPGTQNQPPHMNSASRRPFQMQDKDSFDSFVLGAGLVQRS